MPHEFEEEEEQPMSYSWMFAIVVVLIILFIATITVVAVSVSQYDASLPTDIDIVLIESSNGILLPQATAIDNNMNFRRNIYVLTNIEGRVNGPATLGTIGNIFYIVTGDLDLHESFLSQNQIRGIANVPDIAPHAMFLADYTVPFQFIQKSFLFYGNRPRMFNIFRDTAETTFLASYFTYTVPTLVENIALLDELGPTATLHDYVLFEISQERVVLRNDFNRDIFVNASNAAHVTNTTKQYAELDSTPPLFATFHITGTNQATANESLVAFLNSEFVV